MVPSVLLAVLLCAMSLGNALADDPTPAPSDTPAPPVFTAPKGWRAVPLGAVHSLLSWSNGTSTLGIIKTPTPLPLSMFSSIMKKQAVAADSIVSSTSDAKICGAPAYRLTIRSSVVPTTTVQQFQVIDGASYSSIYSYPDKVKADAAIEKFLASFCGETSVANEPLPRGWEDIGGEILGVWSKPGTSQTISFLSGNVSAARNRLARLTGTGAYNGAKIKILSNTTGTLCGNPAHFLFADIQTSKNPRYHIQVEMTQSNTIAYIGTYGRKSSDKPDAAALASLASLCATDTVPVSSASPTPMPTDGVPGSTVAPAMESPPRTSTPVPPASPAPSPEAT